MDNTKVGEFIKKQLKLNNITQDQLAEKLGISSSAVSQGLSGKNSFDISNLMEIAKILDMDLDLIVNAGKERETNLERLAKMTKEKFVREDPLFKSLQEKDSKGKKLVDYLILHKNIELIKFFQDKGINNHAKGNYEYLALLIETEELDILKRVINHEYRLPNFYIGRRNRQRNYNADRNVQKGYVKNGFISEYDLLDQYEKVIVDAVINTSNENILSFLPYFEEGIDKKNIPVIIYFAIQFDKVKIIEYEDNKHQPYDLQLRHILQGKYEQLFLYSIIHKSKKCLQFFYDKLEIINYKKLFSFLASTKDIEFSKWFLSNFPEKVKNGFHHNNEKVFNNSQSLIQHIKDNDIEMLKFSILFSNQEALNVALENTKEDQINFMKVLLSEGAKFTYHDGYSSQPIQLEQVTILMKYLLEKENK